MKEEAAPKRQPLVYLAVGFGLNDPPNIYRGFGAGCSFSHMRIIFP